MNFYAKIEKFTLPQKRGNEVNRIMKRQPTLLTVKREKGYTKKTGGKMPLLFRNTLCHSESH